MNIGNAVKALKDGVYMARRKWPGITYILLDGEIINYSHLGIDSPWIPTHPDLLATDWYEVIPDR